MPPAKQPTPKAMTTIAEPEPETIAETEGGLRTFFCTRCKEKFIAGDWSCKDGKPHVVSEKTYYSPVANWRVYVEEEQILTIGGKSHMTPARAVQFGRGIYTTRNPRDQASLDVMEGLIDGQRWREIYISKEEQNEMKKRELEARESRVEQREQALLAKIKAQTEGSTT